MPTIPQISRPMTISAPSSGNHITITYTDTFVESVDLNTTNSPFFIQGDGGVSDLLEVMKDALETATNITTANVLFGTDQRIFILLTSSSKTVASITLVQTDFKPYHLGFEVTETGTVINFVSGGGGESVRGDYRPPSTWSPSTEDFDGLRTRRDMVVSQGADDGSGVDDVYTGHQVSSHRIPEVFGVLMRSTLASDSGHVDNVSGLTTGDTNAALDSWLVSLHSLLGGVRPTLRWTPDTSSRSSYRSVRINNPKLYSGIEGWIVDTNEAPLFHDLEFELSEV